MATMNDFRIALLSQIDRAQKQGRPHVEINAGEIHRVLSPDENRHRMICNAMRQEMKAGDTEVFAPPSGDGPSFTVRYSLPR